MKLNVHLQILCLALVKDAVARVGDLRSRVSGLLQEPKGRKRGLAGSILSLRPFSSLSSLGMRTCWYSIYQVAVQEKSPSHLLI